jgi:signal transduction histidine kinase
VGAGPDAITVRVQDSGAGFNVDKALASGTALGLIGMKERAHLLRGHFVIRSRFGCGTLIQARLPFFTQKEMYGKNLLENDRHRG